MPPLDAKALRSALGRFTTGVTIATCRDAAGRAVGLTCNSFNSVSLDPPLVLWSLRAASPAMTAFCAASHFAINILAEGQWADGIGGAPVLGGCTAVFECALHSRQEAGDHVLFIGQVERMHEAALPPLLFQAGHYRLLGEIL